MSFGFVASFVMLNKDHISDAKDVPKIAGAFVFTTLVGYITSYLFTLGSFKLERRLRGLQDKAPDLESGHKSWPSPPAAWPASTIDWEAKRVSRLSQLSLAILNKTSLVSIEPVKEGRTSRILEQIVRTGPLWICLFLIATVGVPVILVTGYDTPFDFLCFTLFWVLSVQIQRWLRNSCRLLKVPHLRSIVVVFANPVLMASIIGTGYLWIKTTCKRQMIDDTIMEFHRHHTLAVGIVTVVESGWESGKFGAGDLSGPVLDAGIVCMGFKMFEYRKELWRGICTVFISCTILATANVFLNVLFAHAMGLQPADALAFAARSITIALGVPAIQNVNGSTSLMSALVIFGGIIYQMIGDSLFSLLQINDLESQPKSGTASRSDVDNAELTDTEGEKEMRKSIARADNAVVAAGVTIGINAAAMGTSHLVERNSRATAYCALSMTIFGTMTVVITSIPNISKIIVSLASR
ncbi:hypothetical protein F5Y11DRAFT_365880 [Daldinia sp. FL1419]|nr:hypothetical protein F5Y11DRAFT_365880 [Daldinia sp. FL1419]